MDLIGADGLVRICPNQERTVAPSLCSSNCLIKPCTALCFSINPLAYRHHFGADGAAQQPV
jgi:hypothetical protein